MLFMRGWSLHGMNVTAYKTNLDVLIKPTSYSVLIRSWNAIYERLAPSWYERYRL